MDGTISPQAVCVCRVHCGAAGDAPLVGRLAEDNVRPLIAGNWKMDGLTARLREIEAMAASVAAKPPVAEVLICTPATLIARAVHIATGPIDIGGQDVPRSEGADVGDFMMRMGIAADHGGFALKGNDHAVVTLPGIRRRGLWRAPAGPSG